MAPLFGQNEDMKRIGEQMQNLSEQIGSLQQQLAQKNAEVDNLQKQLSQTQSSDAAGKLQDAQTEIKALQEQLAALQQSKASTNVTDSDEILQQKHGAAHEKSVAAAQPPQSAPAAGGLTAGGSAWVTRAGGLPLRLRSAPNLEGDILDRLAPGTQMTLLQGPQQGDGHAWWQIRTTDGREGWVAGEDLRTQPD